MGVRSPSPRVLVIGLDTGCGRLVQEWSRQGLLPVMGSLIAEGTWGWLETPAACLHVSGWPSIYTGTLPGKHGVYYTFQPAPGLQGHRRFGSDQYGQPTFWRVLSGAGKKCTVLDATYTHPEKGFEGIQVFEWGTWAWYWRPMSTPPGIRKRMKKALGEYPLGLEANQIGLAALDAADLHERLIRAAQAKTDAILWLMEQAPWDLFVTVYCETHPAAHYCWSPVGNTGNPRADAVPPDLIRKVYQQIDQGIGKILQQAGDDVTVFVVSGDGVGPNHAGWHLLPETLRRLGFLAVPGPQEADEARQPEQGQDPEKHPKEGGGLLKRAKALLPADFRKEIARRLPNALRDAINRRMDAAGIDWSATRAYCLPTDLEGCIRVNLKGREPRGIVSPGDEYERVCREIAEALERLTNPGTGRRAVRQVIRTDEIYQGERLPYLPDLIVLWSGEAEITGLHSEDIGTVTGKSPDARTGTHSPPGFVIARGPSIPRGGTLAGGRIVDIAPTVLELLHVSPPSQMDGKAWGELLEG